MRATFKDVARAKTDGCLPGAIIKRDVLWAGSLVPLPMLATWSQSILYLAEAPSDEGDLRHLLGLVMHNLVPMIDDLRGERR